jgi:Zn-dependent peptidase ImmA (M78 family)
MPWLQADPLGRFSWPIPWYAPGELDDMFETRGSAIFARRHSNSRFYLLTTDDLSVLIEEEGADLDPGFEFTGAEAGFLGKTIFRRGETLVRISRRVAQVSSFENVYRMTLAHEYAHIVLHRQVYEPCFDSVREMTDVCQDEVPSSLHRDPLEWQAGRAAAGLLIPKSVLAKLVVPNYRPVRKGSRDAVGLSELVGKRFKTSLLAAAIRLEQLGYIKEPEFVPDQWRPERHLDDWRTREGLVHCSVPMARMLARDKFKRKN